MSDADRPHEMDQHEPPPEDAAAVQPLDHLSTPAASEAASHDATSLHPVAPPLIDSTVENAGVAEPAAITAPLPHLRRPRPALRLPSNLDAPLVLILLVAAALRVFGYNWDEGTNLHPDERGIVGPIRSIGLPHSWSQFWSPSSPLNPHFSAYGHLPFYATTLFAHALGWLGRTIGGPFGGLAQADITDAGIIESGRVLSGLSDAGALFFVYLIGRMVFGRAVGLLATLLGAFTVLDLEFSHFANVDTYLTFFVAGALYFCVRVVRRGEPRDYAWVGAWIGFALACKVSAAPLLVPLVVAHIYRGAGTGLAGERGRRLPANPLLLLLALVALGIAVFVTMPYAFIDFNSWWGDVWYQLQLARGVVEQPFTRKFSGLPAYWYPLQQLVGWTLGLPLGLTAVAGVVVAVGRQVRRRQPAELVLLSWAAIFFATTAGQYMKFLRYMLPLVPVLNLFAAALLVALWRWGRRHSAARRPAGPLLARAAAVLVVGLTILYGLARENIYTGENTRLAASRWMATHIPAGSTITVEDWDESLPYPPPGVVEPAYHTISLSILGPGDGPSTVPMFVSALQQAQYITISSARVFGSVAHQPGRYPYSIRWYDLLFGNKLNFRLVASFANHPHLGPISIDDYQAVPRADEFTHLHLWYEADQNYSEYDHPPVYIFKRSGPISAAHATALLTENGRLRPQVAAYDPSHSMLLSPQVDRADQQAPTYDQIFPPHNVLAQIPILSWLVMIEVLGLLALPLVLRACRGRLRDGGYGLAKVCGIVIVGYLTWLAASIPVASYSRGLILAACLVLLLLSLAFGLRPRALWAEVQARRRGILWGEGVFLLAFLAFVALRMAYPDLWHLVWGGERTQEVSFMNAILRSQHFPPADPWFAGGTLNYYYYGQYLTGMLMKLTGIAVPVGFNLALPTLYALLLMVAFSIGYNATGRAWVGGAAAALEGVLGNLGPVQQFAALAPVHAAPSILPMVAGLRDAFSGLLAVLTHQVALPSDFFWTSSRILSVSNGDAINEFPIWSFTYGDMHAHVIDEPILLCVIGLALAVSGLGIERAAGTLRRPRERLGSLLTLGALMVVVAGATGPTNLWDLPTSIALLAAGFALRGWFVAGRRGWAVTLRDVLLPAAVLGLVAFVLYRPFYASVLGISSGFTFLQPHTPTGPYLLHFGLLLFLVVSFWLAFLWRHTRRSWTVLEFCLYYRGQLERLPRLFRAARAMAGEQADPPPTLLSAHVLLFGLIVTLAMLVFGFTTLALIAFLVTLGGLALVEALARAPRLDLQASQPFALVLAVVALVLTAIPDVVMQNEAGRMNTFFKLYNQAWPLLALAAALALSALIPRRHAVPAEAEERAPVPPAREPVLTPALAPSALPQGLALAPAGAWSGGVAPSQVYSAWSPRDVAEPDDEADPAAPAGEEAEAPLPPDEGTAPVGRAETAHDAPSPQPAPRPSAVWPWQTLWWAVLAVLVAGGALFPIFGTASHLQLRQSWAQTASAQIPTGLDGAAFVRVLYPADWKAIEWINGHVHGMPVLLTSDRGSYRDFAAKVTMFTGLPTVVSWPGEDMQERYAGQGRPQSQFPPVWINQFESGRVTWTNGRWVNNLPTSTAPPTGTRMDDVETIYNTPDAATALRLLHEYHVSLIYVGTAEKGDPNSEEPTDPAYGNHAGFAPAGLAKFDQMVAAHQLHVVYRQDGVTIYGVGRA